MIKYEKQLYSVNKLLLNLYGGITGANIRSERDEKENILQLIVLCLILLFAFAVAACDDPESEPDPVCECPEGIIHVPENYLCCDAGNCTCTTFSREFNLTLMGKTVVLKDETGGATELSAALRTKLQDALTPITTFGPDTAKFNAIHATGNFAIVVNSGADYPDGAAFDGYRILFRESQLAGYTLGDIRDVVLHGIRYEMNEPVIAKANGQSSTQIAKQLIANVLGV